MSHTISFLDIKWFKLFMVLVYISSYNFSTKVKVVPFPNLDFIHMEPSNYSTICLDMTSPSPMPWVFTPSALLRYPNRLNNLCYSSAFIPIPVSFTLIFKYKSFRFYLIILCFISFGFFSMLTIILTDPC